MSGLPVSGAAATTAVRTNRNELIRRSAVAVLILVLGSFALRVAWVGISGFAPLLASGLAAILLLAVLRFARIWAPLAVLAALTVPAIVMIIIGREVQLDPLASLVDPFPRLLTSPYPAPATADLLLPGLVVTWLVGAVAGWFLLGRRFFLPPLLMAVVLLTTAELLTAGASDPTGLVSFGLLAALLIHWGTWFRGARRGLPQASIIAVILALIGMALGYVRLGTPFQPRDLLDPPVTASDEPNPLPMLSVWARAPRVELLRRSGDPETNLHLVVLPDYDGVSFNSRSEYTVLGSAAKPILPPGRYQKESTVSISWRSDSRWLPAPGVPTAVTVPDARIDVDTGSLLVPNVPNGVQTYTVTGQVDAAHPGEVEAAAVVADPRYTRVPNAPPDFREYALGVVQDQPTLFRQAKALEKALQTDRGFSSQEASGTSYARLHQFLFDSPAEGGKKGTSEQFAGAFAVLARSIGLPTRVVVGFGRGEELPDQPGTRVVKGKDALAWPEVYFEGLGWVPFNPTPDIGDVTPQMPVPPPPEREHPPEEEPPPGQSDGDGQRAEEAQPQEDQQSPLPWPQIVLTGAPLLLLMALLLARYLRTLWHRSHGVLGAWRHVEDGLRLAGHRLDPRLGAVPRAERAGTPHARTVAEAAEQAAFGVGETDAPAQRATAQPGGAAATTQPGAAAAATRAGTAARFQAVLGLVGVPSRLWPDAIAANAQLRRQSSWWRTLIWWLSPVPFLPRQRLRARRTPSEGADQRPLRDRLVSLRKIRPPRGGRPSRN